MSSLKRWVGFAVISLAAACSQETYICFVDGLIETCERPGDAICLTPQIFDTEGGAGGETGVVGGADAGARSADRPHHQGRLTGRITAADAQAARRGPRAWPTAPRPQGSSRSPRRRSRRHPSRGQLQAGAPSRQ